MNADAQAVETSSDTERPEARDLGLEGGDVLGIDQFMIDGRHRVLPDQYLRGDLRAEVARAGAHVAVGQLEPRPGKGVSEFLGVLQVAPSDGLVDRVEAKGEVSRGHHRPVLFGRIMGISHHVTFGDVLGQPLIRAGRTLDQFPLVFEQYPQIAQVPFGRVRLPGALEAAADRIAAFAAAEAALPAEALLFDAGGFRRRTDMRRIARAMALAEGVPAGDERDGLFVVHGHTCEGLPDVTAGGDRIGVAVRPFGVHVNQTHLHGGERVLEIPVTRIAVVAKPGVLAAPVDVLLGLPDVLASAAEAEGLEAHRLQSAVAGEDHQVGPGDCPAVFLLDRPEQTARLVEVHVVRPAVEGRQALGAGPRAAAAVTHAVGAGAVPRHPDEEPPVVTPVGRPPVLRVGHQRIEVLLQGRQVEFLELLSVVERLAHRIAQVGVLMKNLEVQLIRPPVPIRRAAAGNGFACPARYRAFAVFSHNGFSFLYVLKQALRNDACAVRLREKRCPDHCCSPHSNRNIRSGYW